MTIVEFICNELKFQDEHHGTEYLLLQSVLKEQRKIQAKKERDEARGKLPVVVKNNKLKTKQSKFKEKYNDRFASIKTADITRNERRRKEGLAPREEALNRVKREGNKKVNKVSAENKGNEVKPNVKQNIKQEEKVPNRFEEYKAFLKERELEKEREKEREREIKRAKREKEVAEKTKKKDDRNVIHNEDLL